jgi:hypothetical protein
VRPSRGSRDRAQFSGEVLEASDPGYEAARAIHNGLIDKRPTLIARCLNTADIANAVRFGRSEGLEISVRGGGHNPAGKAVISGGLMIDLAAMRGTYAGEISAGEPLVAPVRSVGTPAVAKRRPRRSRSGHHGSLSHSQSSRPPVLKISKRCPKLRRRPSSMGWSPGKWWKIAGSAPGSCIYQHLVRDRRRPASCGIPAAQAIALDQFTVRQQIIHLMDLRLGSRRITESGRR